VKSHSTGTDREKLVEQREQLLRVIEVSKHLGVIPTRRTKKLLVLVNAQLEWLTKYKRASTKLAVYDKRIRRLSKKLGKVEGGRDES
jgi:hypothetical protein